MACQTDHLFVARSIKAITIKAFDVLKRLIIDNMIGTRFKVYTCRLITSSQWSALSSVSGSEGFSMFSSGSQAMCEGLFSLFCIYW